MGYETSASSIVVASKELCDILLVLGQRSELDGLEGHS